LGGKCFDTSVEHGKKYISEMFRVVCEGGVYILLSNADDSKRMKYLKDFNWDINMIKLTKVPELEPDKKK
jgi:hypothetical protein